MMRNRLIAIGSIFLLIMAAYMLQKSAKSDDIVIGLAGPFSGSYAVFGDQLKNAGDQFVKDINAHGGINHHHVRIELADDACDPKQAVNAANDLINKKVALVVGHFCSGSAIPASSVYSENNVPYISIASNRLLTERGLPSIYRIFGRDTQQALAISDYVSAHFADKKIALMHDKSAYGQGLIEQAQQGLHDHGIHEALFETITPGEKDYSALITKLKGAGIDIAIIGGYHTETALILRQGREQGMNVTFIGGGSHTTSEFWSIAGPAGEGMMFSFPPDPRTNPAAQQIVADFHAQHIEPEGWTLFTYAGLQVAAQALEKSGGTDGNLLNQHLHNDEFSTVMGPTRFDAQGENSAIHFVMYEWHEGNYHQLIPGQNEAL